MLGEARVVDKCIAWLCANYVNPSYHNEFEATMNVMAMEHKPYIRLGYIFIGYVV